MTLKVGFERDKYTQEIASQSKYPVLHEGVFGGTGFLFLGHLGSRASTEKKIFGANYEEILRAVYSCFQGQKFF